MKDQETIGEKLFAKLGLDKEADPLKKARALSTEKIIEAGKSVSKDVKKDYDDLWDSTIDGHFLTDTPANIFRAGKENPVPVITSSNLGELTGPGIILMPLLIPDYLNMLSGVNKAGQRGYACIFDRVPSKWKQEGCVSTHAMELSYVFGDWDNSGRWWPILFGLTKASGAKTPDPGLTDADRKVSENMMAMWAQFARIGDPNINGRFTWPAYHSDTDEYLYIADPLQVKSGFSKVVQKQ